MEQSWEQQWDPCPAPTTPSCTPTSCVRWEDEAGEVNIAHQHTGVGFLEGNRGLSTMVCGASPCPHSTGTIPQRQHLLQRGRRAPVHSACDVRGAIPAKGDASGSPSPHSSVGTEGTASSTHRYCPPVSARYISSTDSCRLLPLAGLGKRER